MNMFVVCVCVVLVLQYFIRCTSLFSYWAVILTIQINRARTQVKWFIVLFEYSCLHILIKMTTPWAMTAPWCIFNDPSFLSGCFLYIFCFLVTYFLYFKSHLSAVHKQILISIGSSTHKNIFKRIKNWFVSCFSALIHTLGARGALSGY